MMSRALFTRREFADALETAEHCRGDQALLVATVLELSALRRLHEASLGVVRVSGGAAPVFVDRLGRLPPVASQAWYAAAQRWLNAASST